MFYRHRIISGGVLAILSACAGFRIQELQPSLLISIPVSLPGRHATQSIMATMNGRVAANFPVMPAIYKDQFIIQDAAHGRVAFFTSSADLELLLQEKKPAGYEDDFIKFGPVVPGLIAACEDAVYIEGMVPEKIEERRPTYWIPGSSKPDAPADQRLPGSLSGKERNGTSSSIYIMQNDKMQKKPLLWHGQNFQRILAMTCNDSGQFTVFHETRDKDGYRRILSIFENNAFVRDFEDHPFSAAEVKENHIEIESISPSGQTFLLAAVFRDKQSYQPRFRRIYRIQPSGQNEVILEEEDPGVYFFSASNDGSFWLMEPADDGSRLLLKFFTATGEYQSNRLIEFPGLRASWRETYALNDRIFSSRLYRGNFEIYEWK